MRRRQIFGERGREREREKERERESRRERVTDRKREIEKIYHTLLHKFRLQT